MDWLVSGVEIFLSFLFLWILRTSLRRFPKISFMFSILLAFYFSPFFTSTTSTAINDMKLLHTKTMKAAVFAPGVGEHGVQVLEIPVPSSHTEHEVYIKVNAAGLNPSNYKVNFARLPFYRHLKGGNHIIGYDVEGTVLSTGASEACKNFHAGSNIYGFAAGSIAEYAIVQCSRAAVSPKSISSLEAAGLPIVALTSLEAWKRSNLQVGQNVLVIGASGGCGTFGVSIAKALGAKSVTGICSTRNIQLVSKLGADIVVDYKSQKDMNTLINGGEQFDIIYDTVSSYAPEDPNYEPMMRPLLKKNGKYVAINGMPMDWVRGIWSKILNINIQRDQYDLFLLTPDTKNLDSIRNMIDNNQIPKTVIDTIYTLSNETLNQAFTLIKSRRVVGKICFKF
jgi:NADPH:quinone reductase-like Zn-dependent oxidoreductase